MAIIGIGTEFGQYLRKLRKDKGLTLVELSEITGVSNPYISQIENGKFEPSLTIIAQLANGLGVSKISLLTKLGHLNAEDIVEHKKEGNHMTIQENIDQNRLDAAVVKLTLPEALALLEEINARVCWEGPVDREWLEKEMGLPALPEGYTEEDVIEAVARDEWPDEMTFSDWEEVKRKYAQKNR